MVALLGRLSWGDSRRAVDGFVKDRIIRIILLHRTEIIGTLEEVLALTRCVFGSY
jgi:hypothetical protein